MSGVLVCRCLVFGVWVSGVLVSGVLGSGVVVSGVLMSWCLVSWCLGVWCLCICESFARLSVLSSPVAGDERLVVCVVLCRTFPLPASFCFSHLCLC